jgi:general secretion pathway protein J
VKRQRGMTLVEIMIAIGILGLMMGMAWRSISVASRARNEFQLTQERTHEIRVALDRVIGDLEAAYLSKNEDESASHRRTLFKARKTGKAPEVRFSSLAHRVLWGDANESEQTVIDLYADTDPIDSKLTSWFRKEQRRPSTETPEDEPGDVDVLIRGIEEVQMQFWDWRDEKWQDDWDTTTADGERGRLPTRVRLVVKVPHPDGGEIVVTSQARILMQEPLNFVTGSN